MRLIAMLSCVCLAFGQAADAPSFEVASIKPAATPTPGTRVRVGCTGGPGTSDPGIVTCNFVSLADMIYSAYGFQRYQFTPADWMMRDRFDITAKVPPGTTREQFQQMQQRLLAERFKLTLHHEQKEMAIYELTVGKSGLKMKESAPDVVSPPEEIGAMPKFSMGTDGYPSFPAGRGGMLGLNGRFRWKGSNVTVGELIKTLSNQVGRPVTDATGLKGKYDIDMYWVVESGGGRGSAMAGSADGGGAMAVPEIDPGPTIIRAVQEQLGFKLDSKKGTVDFVVVDHADKVPVEN